MGCSTLQLLIPVAVCWLYQELLWFPCYIIRIIRPKNNLHRGARMRKQWGDREAFWGCVAMKVHLVLEVRPKECGTEGENTKIREGGGSPWQSRYPLEPMEDLCWTSRKMWEGRSNREEPLWLTVTSTSCIDLGVEESGVKLTLWKGGENVLV